MSILTLNRSGLFGRSVFPCLLFLAASIGAAPPSSSVSASGTPPLPSATEIMGSVQERSQGRDQTASAVWRLVDSAGHTRIRKTRFYRRREDKDASPLLSQWLLVFDSPPDIKDTALLVWNPRGAGQGSDQWIYLAGLRKVKRISGNARGTPFLGTDFAFEDISERAFDQDVHRLLRTDAVDGIRHYVIESKPKPDSSVYAKRVQWIDSLHWTISRIDFYSEGDELKKSLHLDWQQAQGIWVWKRLEMTTHRTGHRTVVEVEKVLLNAGLDPDRFIPSALGSGIW